MLPGPDDSVDEGTVTVDSVVGVATALEEAVLAFEQSGRIEIVGEETATLVVDGTAPI